MTNQTDQWVTVDPRLVKLVDLVLERNESIKQYGAAFSLEHDIDAISRELTAALQAQPAPPVQGVERDVIEKAIRDAMGRHVDGNIPFLVTAYTNAVMTAIALAQTGEGRGE